MSLKRKLFIGVGAIGLFYGGVIWERSFEVAVAKDEARHIQRDEKNLQESRDAAGRYERELYSFVRSAHFLNIFEHVPEKPYDAVYHLK